jgi:formate dehydrogenase major subunit
VNITRRGFLKLSGAATGFLLTSSVFDFVKVPKALADFGPKVGHESTSICCCCACGCGMLITTENAGTVNEKVINVEGDPTHPTNEGGLCSKCLSAKDTVNQRVRDWALESIYAEGESVSWPEQMRLARVLYRAPYTSQWQVKTWEWALQKMAYNIVNTRAAGFETTADDMTVNRCTNIACLGGAAHDNQECYLLRKLMTGLGLVYVEHQARI